MAANGFQYAIETTSIPGMVILGVLGLLSVLTWSVLLTRLQILRVAKNRNHEYLELYRRTRYPLEIYAQGLDRRGTPLYSIYAAGARELCLQMLGTSERDDNFSLRLRNAQRIAPTQVQAITLSMDRAIGEMAVRLEEKMSLLATCLIGAPFLGLLGTVWGIMDAFAAVAASSSTASLQSLAAGVSGALVPTVIGLLIAIPAIFGYSHLNQSIKSMVMLLEHHASELGAACERHYVDHGKSLTSQATPPPVLGFGTSPVPSMSTMGIAGSAGNLASGGLPHMEEDEDDEADEAGESKDKYAASAQPAATLKPDADEAEEEEEDSTARLPLTESAADGTDGSMAVPGASLAVPLRRPGNSIGHSVSP